MQISLNLHKKTVAISQIARYVPNVNVDIGFMRSFRFSSLPELGASPFFSVCVKKVQIRRFVFEFLWRNGLGVQEAEHA